MDDSFDDFKTPTGSPVKENPSALEQIVFDGIEENATKKAQKQAELDDLRAAGVELSDDDMFDSDDEAPQAGPMVEDDPEGVDFVDSDDESNTNMLAKQMQFTPADSTIAFELEEQRIMKEAERESSRSPAIGDDSLLDGSMMDGTCMNDTALLDQTSIPGNETFKMPVNPADMTVIEEDEEISIKIKSSAKKLRTPASSTSNSLQEDSSVTVQNPNFEEKDSLEESLSKTAGATLLEVNSTDFDETTGFANEEPSSVLDLAAESVYATALTTPVQEAPASQLLEEAPVEKTVEPAAVKQASSLAEQAQAEQEKELAPLSKGAYTVEYDKFDDPNFNPFESKKAMRNSPDITEELPASKGNYSVDLDKLDDPNFNPFESKKAMQNSPTPDHPSNKTSDASSEANKTIEITARSEPNEEKVTPANDTHKIHSSEIHDVSLPSSDVNTTVNISKRLSMNPHDAAKNALEFESYESEAGTTVKSIPPAFEQEPVQHVQDSETMDISAMSVDEEVANISQEAQESEPMDVSAMSVEEDLPLPTKGAYSVDFDKFDDPNFNPFETKKAMKNSPPPGEEALPVPKVAYTVELDKFDDPNFNPFESKRAMSNSPVNKPTIKPPQESQEPVAPVSEPASTPEKNPVEEPNNATFTLEKEDAAKESTPEGLAELNQTFTPPKRAPPKLGQRKKTSPTKKKSPAKPKPKAETQPEAVDDAPLPAKGAYSIDLDKFDDPNFNPFESKKGISNSSPPGREAIKPAPSGYTMDFDNFDDPNFNPFESKGPKMSSSPPPQKEENQKKEESEAVPSANDEEQLNVTFEAPKRAPPKLGQNRKKVSPKVIKPKAIKPKVQAVEKSVEEEDAPLPAKGYSMDFDKFDDPNFNPFESKKAMSNSPPPGEEAIIPASSGYTVDYDKFDDPNFNPFESKKAMRNSPELDKTIEPEPELEKLDDKMDDPTFNPFEAKSTIRNSPSPTLAKPKSSGYSMNLDDLNSNPFETKKSIPNVEVSPEEVSPQNLTKTISKSDLNTTNGSDDFHSVTGIKPVRIPFLKSKKSKKRLADEGNDENEDPNSTFDIAKNTTEKGDSISKSFVKEKSFASVQSNASQDAYVRGLEKLLFDMEASFKKEKIASQALIVRQAIEIEQLREDLSAVEQSSADALQRHMRVKEKCMLQAQNEEKLRKSNVDYEARHHEDNDRYDALVERSNSLVAKANEEIEKLEQETTLRIRCLEVENKKTKLELTSTLEKYARVEQEKAELIKLCDDLVNFPSRNPV